MGITSTEFEYLRQLVYQQSSVALDADKRYLADLRLPAIAAAAGFDSVASLVAELKAHPLNHLHTQVVEALVTYETSFFRDTHPFEALATTLLPSLIQRRSAEQSLAIWCAACSTGQEPYSIAMLIDQQFPQLTNWRVHLIASDFSNQALAYARRGLYNQIEIRRGLSDELRRTYFHQHNGAWQIKDELRQKVEFRQINLIHALPLLPQIDIVFLRNVLIYFDIDTRKTVLAKVRQHLKSDGYLFLGGSETAMNLGDFFVPISIQQSICYQLVLGSSRT